MYQQSQGLTSSWIFRRRESNGAVWFSRNQDKLRFLKLWVIQIPYLYYQQKAVDWTNIPASQEASLKLKVMSDEFLWPQGRTLPDTRSGGGCAALLSVPIPTLFLTLLDFSVSCCLVQLEEYSCWGCFSTATLPSFPAPLLHNLCPSRDIINPINFKLWPNLGKNTSLPSHWDISASPKYFSLKLHFHWQTQTCSKQGNRASRTVSSDATGWCFQGRGAWTSTLENLGLIWACVSTFLRHSVKFSEHSVDSATVNILIALMYFLCSLVYFCYSGKLWGHFCDHSWLDSAPAYIVEFLEL